MAVFTALATAHRTALTPPVHSICGPLWRTHHDHHAAELARATDARKAAERLVARARAHVEEQRQAQRALVGSGRAFC